MLSLSNRDVAETLREFKTRDISVTFLVPTETGIAKSIMDATSEVRDYLKLVNAHDYDGQGQGKDHKKSIPTTLVAQGAVEDTSTSLYRPQTKHGDPRIWIYQLSKFAKPGDLIALAYMDGQILAVNCSTTDLPSFLDKPTSPARRFQSEGSRSGAFEELLNNLREIAGKGFVPTLRPGDTGVGFTLETLLGIPANSSKKPDYRGIELKASRLRTARGGQSTIFSQVPDWKSSRLDGSRAVLEERGRYNAEKDRRQLFHEISTKAPNSYGLQLKIDDDNLRQIYVSDEGDRVEDVIWSLDTLKGRVAAKHTETAWITAKTKGRGKDEEFWYTSVKHTAGADLNAFPILIESGAITVHYLIKETPTGGAKDQGYLFKTSSKNLDLLFASVEEVDLLE